MSLVSVHQRFAQGAPDLLDREWFAYDIVHQRVQPVRPLALIGMACHQHDRNLRMIASGGERERNAAYHRHLLVSQR